MIEIIFKTCPEKNFRSIERLMGKTAFRSEKRGPSTVIPGFGTGAIYLPHEIATLMMFTDVLNTKQSAL